MVFFETFRDNELYYNRGDNSCALHLHRSIELVYVTRGTKKIKLGNQNYELLENDLLVCPPYQPHTFYESENSEQIVTTAFLEYCPQFHTICQHAKAQTNVFHDTKKQLLPLFESLDQCPNKVLFCGLINIVKIKNTEVAVQMSSSGSRQTRNGVKGNHRRTFY